MQTATPRFVKHLLKALVCTALAALPPLCAASTEPDYEEEMKALAIQRKTLADSGFRGFFAVAQSNRWDAPKIHSQCWVDWLPRESTKRIQLEQAKRDFGLELVKAVEEEALRVLSPASTGERASQADRLLDFSGWAGRPGGYGNLAIKWRVEHLACIPIGHLIADLDFPVEEIEARLARLETEQGWVRMQVDVLNEEAPHQYRAKTKDDLAVEWHGHFRKAAFAFKDERGRYPYDHEESKDLPRHISFYCEDESSPRPYTLATKWSQKRHFLFCVRGKTDAITDRVHNLLLFRKMIGRFPLKPSRPLGSFEGEEVREAFYEAWMPHEKKFGKKGSGAARSYTQILNNAFMDYDTSELVGYMQEQAAAAKKEEASGKKPSE
ncbi:MAG: hypothetical protein ACOX5G_07955 [Kiritimatiellia bacterium]|jgi:hypothetical protein